MKRKFKCICPYCKSEIIGCDDWENDDICIQGYCKKCKKHILEDEADWIRTFSSFMTLSEILKKLYLAEINVQEAEVMIEQIIIERVIAEFERKRNEVKEKK